MYESLENRFLIAMPALVGDCFDHAVVYIDQHNDEGAMGIIINKPMQIKVPKILEHLNIDNNNQQLSDRPVMMGGPVDQGQGFILQAHNDGIKLSTSKELLADIAENNGPSQFLVALGFSGWNQGQLEQEIKDNYWLVTDVDHKLLFETPLDLQWQRAVEQLGICSHQLTEHSGHA